MKLSDYVVRFFERQGVKDIFMVTGGGCMHLVNSFGNSRQIKYWCTHHEQSTSMAAEAYSKMKNDLGLVLTTSGPGATNTITGMLDSWQDSMPVVFLFGQVKSKQTCLNSGVESLRQFGVQEANIIPVVEAITKYAVEIADANQIRYHLEKAVHMARSGRPGPVVLSIPLDIQSANINEKELKGYYPEKKKFEPSNDDMSYLLECLRKSERPIIIGGHGIRLADACQELEVLVSKYGIPVVTPIMGIDILPGEHPCNVGRVGTKGTRAGNFAMQNADVILSVGSRLSVSVVGHEYEMFGREAVKIAVDIDKAEHTKKTIELDRVIEADAKLFLQRLNQEMEGNFSKWLVVCQEWKKRYPVVIPEYENDAKGINYYKFIDILNKYSKPNMPFISDAGSAFYVVAQTVNLKKGQRHITTGGTATMGFSLPAAIGVCAAQQSDAVIAITGEGSFMQNLQETEVLRKHDLNAKIFIMCNDGYFSIHATQRKFFAGNYVGAGIESGLSFTNIEKLAEAFQVKYYCLDTISQAENYMEQILNEHGPALIEVKVDPNMEIIPTTASQMKDNGVMVSKPLEDMYPFLSRNEFEEIMIVQPVNE